ncbi:MAG: hypothetical protein ACI8P3_000239 [Saprospiraceae bacterium]|jgi:hypothetical protein
MAENGYLINKEIEVFKKREHPQIQKNATKQNNTFSVNTVSVFDLYACPVVYQRRKKNNKQIPIIPIVIKTITGDQQYQPSISGRYTEIDYSNQWKEQQKF